MILKDKRGDASEGIVFLVTIFFLAISLVIVAFALSKVQDVIQDTPLNSTDASDSVISGIENLRTQSVQRGFMLLFGFLIIGIMISSFLVRVHPAWFFIYVIFAIIAVMLAALFANAYNKVISVEALQEIAAEQTMINWVMEHIVQVIIGVIGLSVLLLFAKIPTQLGVGGGGDI